MSKADRAPKNVREKSAPVQTPSIKPLLAEAERYFQFINQRYYKGQLAPVIFNVYPQTPNGHRLGHYWPKTWEVGGEEKVAEIVFYADGGTDRDGTVFPGCLELGAESFFSTALHEIVHHAQATFGKPGKNNFHNAEWHAMAREVGLATGSQVLTPRQQDNNKLAADANRFGYSKPDFHFLEVLKEFNPRISELPFRDVGQKQRSKTKGKMRKYACGCGYSIYLAVADEKVTLSCSTCGNDVKQIGGEEEDGE